MSYELSDQEAQDITALAISDIAKAISFFAHGDTRNMGPMEHIDNTIAAAGTAISSAITELADAVDRLATSRSSQ